MNIFAIADLHLSFGENVDKPMDVFGPSWTDYERRLEENWRALVEPEDLVLIPGDISWAMHFDDALPDLAWIDSLPGEKLIFKGNHDLWWSSLKKMQGCFESITFMQHSAYIGEDFAVCGSRGWILPSDPDFGEADAAIYRRELLRLGMSLDEARPFIEAAAGCKAPEDPEAGRKALEDPSAGCKAPESAGPGAERRPFLLIGALHYPPCSIAQKDSDFSSFFESNGFDKVVYGHLHGEAAFAGAFEGIKGDTEYRLCSLDRLRCVPLLVAKDVRRRGASGPVSGGLPADGDDAPAGGDPAPCGDAPAYGDDPALG